MAGIRENYDNPARNAVAARIAAGILEGKSLIAVREALPGAMDKRAYYGLVLDLVRSGQIPNALVCACGHDCSRCKTFLATLADDDALRREVAAFYREAFGRDMAPEEVHCYSGRSDELMEGCKACPFLQCCGKRGIETCFACEEYPCGMLAVYEKRYVNKVNQI